MRFVKCPPNTQPALAQAPAGLLGALGWGVWESPFWLLLGREGVWGRRGRRGRWGGCPGPPRARPHPAHSGRAWLWDFQLRGPGLLVDYTTEEIPHTPACGTAHSEASSTSPGLPTSVQLPASTPPPPTPLHTWGPQMVQRQNPPAKGLCVLFPGLFLPTMTEGKGATEGVG